MLKRVDCTIFIRAKSIKTRCTLTQRSISYPFIFPKYNKLTISHDWLTMANLRFIFLRNSFPRTFKAPQLTFFASEPLESRPYLLLITSCHGLSFSRGNLHNHFTKRARFLFSKLQIPNHPYPQPHLLFLPK